MAANGPIRMPQALKILCLAQVGRIPFSHFPPSSLWCNKNWPPSMKVKNLQNFRNIIGANGCKWSNSNAPGTKTPDPFIQFIFRPLKRSFLGRPYSPVTDS